MIFSFLFIYIFVVNIVYYVVHIVCEVDVIANSLVLYLPFCSTLNKNFFSSSLLFSSDKLYTEFIIYTCSLFFICNNKVAMARARCGIGCEYTVYSGYLP